MFDIGFSELLLIAVVALVVIGPERLPGVARNMGHFAGRLQRYVSDIKRDINREIEFEEIRRLQQEMETTVQSMQESMRAVETTLKQEVERHQTDVSDAVTTTNGVASPVKETNDVNKETPALAKPRVRKKREATAESVAPVAKATPTPTPPLAAARDDEQFRLF